MKVVDPPKDAPKVEKPKRNLTLPIIAAVLFIVGVGAGFGSSVIFKPSDGDKEKSDEEASAEEGAGEKAEEVKEEGKAHGEAAEEGKEGKAGEGGDKVLNGKHIVTLGDFIVNLRGTGGARVLRMQIQAMGAADAATACTAAEAPIRDAILTLASDYTYTDVEGLDGKLRLRDELLHRVNGIIKPAKVENLYFTAFVVQ